MSQVHLNHGDSPTLLSNAHNSSDSHHFRRAIRDMVGVCKLRMIVFAFLQPLVRRDELVKFYAVLETTLTALRSHNRGVSRNLQLKFSQEMPAEVFTGELIVGKGDGTLEVTLVDGATGDVVRHGHGTSGKIEIVPVEENFDPSRESWTFEDFNSKIVVGNDGRKSLLGKNPYLKMEEGNAPVCGIKFKHARKWMKKGRFRLGARVVHQPNAIRIREAVSEPFIVKDRRGKSKKNYPPSPTDEVWRLKNIGKGGAFHDRLVEENILTVKDFLIEFMKNPERLRDILGNMSNARWKATSDHALTCPLQIMPFTSTSFGNSELQRDKNNRGLGSQLLLSQTSSSADIPSHTVASLKALSRQSDTDGFSQLYFSFDDINAMCVQQNAPSSSEDWSDWVAEYMQHNGTFAAADIDEASAGVATNSPGVGQPKFGKGWAKMSSLVRWFSLKKAIASKTLHVAKKRRLC